MYTSIDDVTCRSGMYFPLLCQKLGSFQSGIFLSRVLTSNGDAVFSTEFEELGLSKVEIEKSRSYLKDRKILDWKSKGKGGTVYSVNNDILLRILNGEELVSTVVQKPVKEQVYTSVIAPMRTAFAKYNLGDPPLTANVSNVKMLLQTHTPDEIAECWSDVKSGKYGPKNMYMFLNFGYMIRNDIVSKWKEWRNGTHNGNRPGERPDDIQSPKSGGWESL